MMGFVNEETENGEWQTIDNEKKIVLKRLKSGMPTGPYEFALYTDNQEIKFLAYRNIDSIKSKNDYIKWHVVKIYLPNSLQKKKKYVIELIEEALRGHGFAFSQKNIEKLDVTFTLDF